MEKLRIIVGGYIGLYPTGGATWDYIQYPVGLQMLGHDVYYIEDTRQYPVFQKESLSWNDASSCISYLKETMEMFGFAGKLAYRDIASGKSFGMSEHRIAEICRTADVFINISCSTYLRDEYQNISKRILIDSDPMFTQIQYAMESTGEADKKWNTKFLVDNHNYLFTFGENINQDDCKIPVFDYKWYPTRQPVCLNLWKNTHSKNKYSFTSIMNWSGREKLKYQNDEWGQKDVEFEKYKSIPSIFPKIRFEVVINKPLNKESYFDKDELHGFGWKILSPDEVVSNSSDYKFFIQNSEGEFSVAKETYVKSNSGWFSCRSACYLASGRPVITEETGWSKYIPQGKGLFSFNTLECAIDNIKQVTADYKFHSNQALEIASEYFDSNKVLKSMLEKIL
jgi:hypothetical protein